MSALIGFALSAPGALTALAAISVWFSVRPHPRLARRVIPALALAYLAASIYAIPYLISRIVLVRALAPFTQNAAVPARTAIVILGGGGRTVRGAGAHIGIMNDDTAARVLEGYRVYTLSRADWIISSGGIPSSAQPGETSATMMRDALVRFGVPPSKILLEADSQTTNDEAVRVAQMLRELGVTRVILVTSDIHMRRSLGAFRAQGVRPIPAIAADPRRSKYFREWITPSNHGLEYTQAVVHELIGIAYYAVRGHVAY